MPHSRMVVQEARNLDRSLTVGMSSRETKAGISDTSRQGVLTIDSGLILWYLVADKRFSMELLRLRSSF